MPDRHSTPARPAATQRATNGSHGSPAATSSRSPSSRTPREAIRSTVPGKPASATTRFEPPASTSSGIPAASAARTAATISGSSNASTSRRGRSAQAQRREVGERRAHIGPAYEANRLIRDDIRFEGTTTARSGPLTLQPTGQVCTGSFECMWSR